MPVFTRIRGQTNFFNYILVFVLLQLSQLSSLCPPSGRATSFSVVSEQRARTNGQKVEVVIYMNYAWTLEGEKEGPDLNSVDSSRALHSTSTLLLYPEHCCKH